MMKCGPGALLAMVLALPISFGSTAAAVPPTSGLSGLSGMTQSHLEPAGSLRQLPGSQEGRRRPPPPRQARSRTVAPLPDTPVGITVDQTTDTLYALSNDVDSDTDTGRLVVIDTRTCRVGHEHCRGPVASIGLGRGTTSAVLDPATRTLYVTESDDHQVAVLDVSRCTAHRTSGCRAPVARVVLDSATFGLGLDRNRHTLYAPTETVTAVIDTASCNARVHTGCTPVASIPSGNSTFPDVEESTGTLYIPRTYDGAVAVVDLATCNATVTTGCATPLAEVAVDGNPVQAQLDPRTSTLYVTAYGPVALIDVAHCRAGDVSGCGSAAVGSTPGTLTSYDLDLDVAARVAYVSGPYFFDAVAAVDLRHCSARDLTGCGSRPVAQQTISSVFGMDRAGRSLYVTNYQTRGIQVLDARACTPSHQDGCRREAPMIAGGGFSDAIDPIRQILYTNVYDAVVGVLDTRSCNLRSVVNCPQAMPTVDSGFEVEGMEVDPGTQTLYAKASRPVDPNNPRGPRINEIKVVDTRRCAPRVSNPTCVPVASVPVDGSIDSFAIDRRTHTVYASVSREVPGQPAGQLAVLHGDHCRAQDVSGCTEPITYLPVTDSLHSPTVAEGADTVYLTGQSDTDTSSGLLAVVPTGPCNRGGDGTGRACAVAATTAVGTDPIASSEDAAHHTLYATSSTMNQVSVVDTRACNAQRTRGCARRWASAPAGNVAFGVTYAPQSRTAFVLNASNATVSVIDTRRCNATDTSRCNQPSPLIAVDAFADVARADPKSDTLFVNNAVGTVSLLSLNRPCASGLCARPRR